jgi:carboxyl-terminal processing protease
MKAMLKSTTALIALLGAFYLSISYQYGDPGWRLKFSMRAAQAQLEGVETYDLKSLSILNRAVLHIKDNYVDPSRINERRMIGAAMEEVQRSVAELMVEVERDGEQVPTRITVRIDKAEQSFDLRDVGNMWQLSFKFKDIFKFVQDSLAAREVGLGKEPAELRRRLQDIEYAAINGMLSTLDPHSVLLRPEAYREMKDATRGKFGGLGIVISIKEGQLTIVNPMEDSPASKAGLKAGDRIVQIGLDSTVNMALEDAVNLLRGDADTTVDIHVLRSGWNKPRKFTLARADIKVKSVASRLLADRVGLVKLRGFQGTTFEELEAALKRMAGKGKLKGLVIDLRGNPGGLLDQAIKVSDLFVESGPIVTTVGYGDKVREPKMATRAHTETYPVVVLTDPQSASASEIVAGALKNHERALIIGQQTFGKGSVQVIYDNKDDSALKLTIAQYLTPGEISIQSVGIAPDIATHPVVLSPETTLFFRSEGLAGEKDLPAHLDHESAQVSREAKPAHTVRYLRAEAAPAEPTEEESTLVIDFEIELAQRIIAATDAGHRAGMLQEAGAIIERARQEEEARIIQALATRGVDWQPMTAGAAPKARVEITTDRPENRVVAGDTATLQVTVHNDGAGPFVRLRGQTDSENEAFAGLELIFGNIPPGQSRSWSVPVVMPRSALSRRDPVVVTFFAEAGEVPAPAELKVSVEQLPRPRLALVWWLDDGGKGNGDGVLQRGEEAELVVEVKNLGEGRTFELLGTLRDDAPGGQRALFINQGRVTATTPEGGLAPGQQTRMRFGFKAKEDGPLEIPVQVSAYDSELREGTTERVRLRVVDPKTAPVKERVRLLPRQQENVVISGLYGGSELTLATAPYAISDGKLGDWYRVPLASTTPGEQVYGWAWASDVTLDAAGDGVTTALPMVPKGPPVITFSDHDPQPETREDALTLTGEVLGEKVIKDLLIFVNNRKVFFKSGGEGDRERMRFQARVPLEKGVNRITVIAREDEDLQSRRTVIVHRAE